MRDFIEYRSGYKHQLASDYVTKIGISPVPPIEAEFFSLMSDGHLLVRTGYAWDGASGPAIDTPNFMRGSLVHDVLYQMMGEGLLHISCRKQADMELRRIIREDGMAWVRAQWVYRFVRLWSRVSATPEGRRKIKTAGRGVDPIEHVAMGIRG